MIVALAVLLSAGVAAAAMRRGGVTESRGVTGEPAREFRAPPRRARVAPVKKSSVDSLAASVRDSVALLIGRPPAYEPSAPVYDRSPTGSQEVNVPAPLQRRDPLARQIQQMLPDTREADPEPPPRPSAGLHKAGDAAEMTAANARARIDSATRKNVKPTFTTKATSPPRR